MNSTGNFGLSQWDYSDRIMMKDFNSDNAKIDAALLAAQQGRNALEQRMSSLEQKTPYVKLQDITTSTGAAQVDLDLSSIVFGNYQAVHLDLALRGASGSNVSVYINGDQNCGNLIRLFTSNGQFYTTTFSGIALISLVGDIAHHPTFPRISLPIKKDGDNYIVSQVSGGYIIQNGYCSEITFNNLHTINLVASSGTILANSKITIWGEV